MRLKNRNRARRDGRSWVQAIVVKKSQKFGRVLEETHLSTKRPVLITGAHHAGKSYWLERLRKDAARVWANRADATPLSLAASGSLAEWVDGRHLELWWAGRNTGDDPRPWAKLKPFEKQRALPLYLKDTRAVLFVDDAHALTTHSKKGKLAQECVRAADLWVIAAADEGRLFPGLRQDVLGAEPQIFRLDSDVAYDATAQFMWLVILICIGLGWWEAGLVLGGLKALSNGRRATKQA